MAYVGDSQRITACASSEIDYFFRVCISVVICLWIEAVNRM